MCINIYFHIIRISYAHALSVYTNISSTNMLKLYYAALPIQLIIRTIPTVVLFEDGVAKGKIIGFDGLTEGLPGTCLYTIYILAYSSIHINYMYAIVYCIVLFHTVLCTSNKVIHTICVCLSCALNYEH